MIVKHGKGLSRYGPGVNVELTGDEVATAIDAYLVAHGVHVSGPRTVTVNGELCKSGLVYVDPSGFVIDKGKKTLGRGTPYDWGPRCQEQGTCECLDGCGSCEGCGRWLGDEPERIKR